MHLTHQIVINNSMKSYLIDPVFSTRQFDAVVHPPPAASRPLTYQVPTQLAQDVGVSAVGMVHVVFFVWRW